MIEAGAGPGIEIIRVSPDTSIADALHGASVLVTENNRYSPNVAEAVAGAPDLAWIQLFSAGFDRLTLLGVPARVAVANAGDAWSAAVAEHAMALFLAHARRIPALVAAQARRHWARELIAALGGLEDATLVIVGFGSIGREVARRARAFGMRIIGVSRSGVPDPLADEMQPATALAETFGKADCILLAVPYTTATHRLIGAAELAYCRPHAILVNVARGGVIDTAALADALRSGRIGAAGLDVTDPEPLPPENPLWDCPNLILSPHVAAFGGMGAQRRLAALFAENLARFRARETPRYQVAVEAR